MGLNRRTFLQRSLAGAAAVTAGTSGLNNVSAKEMDTKAWTDGMEINPAIANTKVICCFDENMTESDAAGAGGFAAQNAAIKADVVARNLDQMAIRLAGTEDPLDAWGTIFRKPEDKEWSEVKVAVKVNCIYTNLMPHVPIVGKVCSALIDLGVTPSNITLYDACHNAHGKYDTYVGDGIPEGVSVSDVTKTGESVSVGSGNMTCASVVLESDILVNCAINKGHSQTNKGGFTLTMKNHTGTMKFSCPSLTEMIDQNKSDAILGGSPPRQQLCIVDCLWSAVQGPFNEQSHFTNRIVMGTMGPLVDIAVAKKLREAVMNATHNDSAIETILTSFGYAEDDIEWDEFAPTAIDTGSMKNNNVTRRFTFSVNKGAFSNSKAIFFLPVAARQAGISIFNLKGHLLHKLHADVSDKAALVWDGRTGQGASVANGTYIVELTGDTFKLRNTIKISR